jgi:hypothetical protein
MIQLSDMKFKTLLLAFFFTGILYSQSPAKFSYQSVVRNSQNSIVSNSNVGIRISILQGSITGAIVYMETHNAQTNANGLFTIEIGAGTVQNGNFSNINWGVGPYFTKTEIDPTGGTNYSISGSSQMLSVPYALYAENSGNLLNQWSHGTIAPQVNQGTVGDYYLNTITGDVYQKNTTSTWTLISNLMGPQGNAGVHGINCWDINNNGINDPSEDTNNDGIYSALDCQGPQGIQGPSSGGTQSQTLSTLIPESAALLAPGSIYTVPAGKIVKISNAIFSSSTPGYGGQIKINGTPIIIAEGTYYGSSSSFESEAEKYFILEDEIILPSGTTLEVLGDINLLNIQEYPNQSSYTVKIVNSLQTVPLGKKWNVITILHSSPFTTTLNYAFKINGVSSFAGLGKITGSSPPDKMYRSYINGSLWLPQNTSLEPSNGIYGFIVLEY